jgi:hypothetical protein
MIRTPVAVNTASPSAVNFVSRSRIRNLRPSAWPYDRDLSGLVGELSCRCEAFRTPAGRA